MRFRIAILVFCAVSLRAQDGITIGSVSGAAGGTASIPISVRDATGTPLGTDAGTGNRIQGIAFKVMFPAEMVDSIAFARAGVTASLTPLFETTLQGDGWIAYVVAFSELSNAIPFTPNATSPGDQIGTLTVTLDAQVPTGTTVALTFHAPSTLLSNQAGSELETIAAGNLSLVNGSVSVVPDVPANVVATAISTSQVNVTWAAVPNADSYEVWRSVDDAAYAVAGTPGSAAFSDTSVIGGKTYLYKVLAVDGSMSSSFSAIDPATTIFFTDDPLVAQSTIVQAIHFAQLRAAVNAFRVSAGLATLASDPTIVAGAVVRAQHVTDLRTALDEARSAAGVSALSYTDPTPTVIKAAHLQELRSGVK